MNLIFLNWLTVAIAISAFTFSNIITEPGQILSRVQDFLERKLPEWLYKPLIGCQYCISGQWALWIYIYLSFTQNDIQYHWWLHLWLIMQSIFVTKIVTYLYYQILDK